MASRKYKEIIIMDRQTTTEEKEEKQIIEPLNVRITSIEISGNGAKLTSGELLEIMKLFAEKRSQTKIMM